MENNKIENKQIKDYDREIDIFDFLDALWLNKLIIITLAVVISLLMVVKTVYYTNDTYTAYGVLYVSNRNENDSDVSFGGVSKNDLDSARTLSDTYIETLNLRSFLLDVSQATDNKYSWTSIKRMMSVTRINDTELIRVAVTASNPEDAYFLADTIIDKAGNKLTEVSNGGTVTNPDEVVMPIAPNDKGVVKNAILGALIGAVLGVVLVALVSLFDRKIHKAEDITKKYGISVLGELVD